ncbi:tetratricopeptide repeat protein [Candidatus Peregrinibacteria bacterium]|nr:tetratricopeptide repeat protein [Candidatus Peregrinibacteria bacterium]
MPKRKHNDQQYPEHILDALEHIEDLKLSGEHKKSIEEAEKLLFSDPDCVAALEEIADNFVSLDDFGRAEKACARALTLDKDSYTAHYILGFITSQKQDWPKAIDFLKKSNDLHPNNPEILRCLGWALFNSGKRTQGIIILERALNLDHENSLTLCDLGICYLQVKNFEKSVEILKRALTLDPNNKRIQDCYKAAKNLSDRVLNGVTKNRLSR